MLTSRSLTIYIANVGATATNAIPIKMMDEKAPLLYRFSLSSPVQGRLVVEMTLVVAPDLFACRLNMELVRALRSMGILWVVVEL